MTADYQVRYDFYGITECPYGVGELNPLDDERHEELHLKLDGFIVMSQIEAVLDRAVAAGKGAFFLISGEGRSGRTSLANVIMFNYCKRLEIPPDKFKVYRPAAVDNDHRKLLRETVLWLQYTQLIGAGRYTDNLLDRLFDKIEESEQPSRHLLKSAAYLASNYGPYGVCYEKAPSQQLLSEAIEVFADARTVVVFTHDDYRHFLTFGLTKADRQAFGRTGLVVNLSHLSPSQVRLLAEKRWTSAAGATPCPFTPDGLEASFAQRRDTVGKALFCLSSMLRRRLIGYDSDARWPGPPQPPGLVLDREFLVREMGEMDQIFKHFE